MIHSGETLPGSQSGDDRDLLGEQAEGTDPWCLSYEILNPVAQSV